MAPSLHSPRGVDFTRYFGINLVFSLGAFFSIRTHQQTSLDPELPQMMIDVFGSEDAPLAVTQSSEGGMRGKGLGVDQS